MVNADAARNAVGVIGNVISLFLFLSPVPTFYRILKNKGVENYSPTPYLATLVNCMVWVLYGLPMVHPKSLLVVTINGSGTAIELIYIILFLLYSDKKNRIKLLFIVILEIIFIAILSTCVLIFIHSPKKRSTIVGFICICFNIMMYASPLSVMKMVITTKSVKYMPFFLSFASFANGVAWSSYALIHFDPFIAVPNGLGSLFALAQLVLYAIFYKSTKRQIAAKKEESGEVGLSEVVVNGNSKDLRGLNGNMASNGIGNQQKEEII